MKKLLLLVGLLSYMVPVNSQGIQSIEAGPKLGLNISSWGGDDFDTNSKTGLHLGGFAIFQFSEQFALQPELYYSAQGVTCSCGSTENEIPVNYLNLPILAKIDVYEGIYLNAGPQIAFLLSAQDGGDSSAEDEFSGTDFSFAIGAGYALPMGLHFQLRYNIGLSNINSEDFDENTKSKVFQLSVGYILWKKEF